MYVLLAYPSLRALAAARARLDADAEFQKAGAEFHRRARGQPGLHAGG